MLITLFLGGLLPMTQASLVPQTRAIRAPMLVAAVQEVDLVRPQEEDETSESEAVTLEGEMRVEPFALFESRLKMTAGEERPRGAPEPQTFLRYRITGERLPKLIRVGRVIFEECKTDDGTSLIAPDEYTEQDLTETLGIQVARTLKMGHWPVDTRLELTPRAAKSLNTRGYVNIVLGEHHEEVVIEDPLSYVGKTLEHERLKELGIKVYFPKPGQDYDVPRDLVNRTGFAVQFQEGSIKVKATNLFDGWMVKMASRGRTLTLKDGSVAAFFHPASTNETVNEDTSVVFRIYNDIEELKLPFEFTHELP